MAKPEYSNSKEWEHLLLCDIIEEADDHAEMILTTTEACQNPHGFLHGGIQAFAVDEYAMKFLYRAFPAYRFLTVGMIIDYIKPIRLGKFKFDIKITNIDLTTNRGHAIITLSSFSGTLCTKADFEFSMYRKKQESNEIKSI